MRHRDQRAITLDALRAIKHRQHNDQRHDTERQPGHGDDGSGGNKPIIVFGENIAQANKYCGNSLACHAAVKPWLYMLVKATRKLKQQTLYWSLSNLITLARAVHCQPDADGVSTTAVPS